MSEEALMIRISVTEGSTTEGVGARLKRLRLQRGLSQRDLSSPGVSYAYISRIEAGARTPSVKALRKLSQKLGVSVEYLETGRDLSDRDQRELRLAEAELTLRLEQDSANAEAEFSALVVEAQAAGDSETAAVTIRGIPVGEKIKKQVSPTRGERRGFVRASRGRGPALRAATLMPQR